MTKDDQTFPVMFNCHKITWFVLSTSDNASPPFLTLFGGDDPISAHTAHDVAKLSLMSWAQLLARRNWG